MTSNLEEFRNLETRRLYREERTYRADKLVEKCLARPELKGIQDLDTNTSRNLVFF